MGRRFQIDGEQQGDLTRRKIRLIAANQMKIHVMPKLQSFRRRKSNAHRNRTPLHNFIVSEPFHSGPGRYRLQAKAWWSPLRFHFYSHFSGSCAVALFDQAKERMDCLGFAASWAAGLCCGGPGKDVEMNIGFGAIDEALEKQGRGQRSGKA